MPLDAEFHTVFAISTNRAEEPVLEVVVFFLICRAVGFAQVLSIIEWDRYIHRRVGGDGIING